jgi:Major intrinsic protein
MCDVDGNHLVSHHIRGDRHAQHSAAPNDAAERHAAEVVSMRFAKGGVLDIACNRRSESVRAAHILRVCTVSISAELCTDVTLHAAEVVGTFFATYVVLEIACNPRSKVSGFAPVVVGATFAVLLIVLTPFSSGSLNPARSLGPAAIVGDGTDLWIFIVAPVVGALAAVPIHLCNVVRALSPLNNLLATVFVQSVDHVRNSLMVTTLPMCACGSIRAGRTALPSSRSSGSGRRTPFRFCRTAQRTTRS